MNKYKDKHYHNAVGIMKKKIRVGKKFDYLMLFINFPFCKSQSSCANQHFEICPAYQ